MTEWKYEDRCPVCYKAGYYYRKKTDDFRCPHCGDVWEITKSVEAVKAANSPSDSCIWAAALLLHTAGRKVDANGILAVLTAAGVRADRSRAETFIASQGVVNTYGVPPLMEGEESGMAGLGALFG